MKIISHRGANLEFPENTLESFERALQIGVDAIEADAMLSKDGQVVIRHDDLIEYRGKWFYVRELTLEELQSIELGKGCHIPTVQAFLDRFSGKTQLLLDVKGYGTCRVLAENFRKLKEPDLSKIHVTSFIHSEILDIRKAHPQLSASLAFAALPLDFSGELKAAGVREVSLFRGYLTRETVERLRDAAIGLRVYTVNMPWEAVTFKSWGANAIFTDDPAAMKELPVS